jgi:hypothetical protein
METFVMILLGWGFGYLAGYACGRMSGGVHE